MERFNKLLFRLISATTLGLASVSISLLANNQEPVEVEASNVSPVSNFYKRVTDVSKLTAGNTVVIRADNGSVLKGAGGNPGYVYGTSKNSNTYLSTDTSGSREYLYADSAYIAEWTIYNGTQDGSIAFQSTGMRVDSAYDQTVYLSYSDYNYYADSNTYQRYNYVSYWLDSFGLDSQIRDASSFVASYNTEGGNMSLTNVLRNAVLGYSDSGARAHFTLGGDTTINLFTPIDLVSSYCNIITNPTKTSYSQGETLDLSGLVVELKDVDGDTFTLAYDDNEEFFSHYEYVVGSTGECDQTITVGNDKLQFNITITITSSTPSFRSLTSDLKDYRGTFIIGANTGTVDGYMALGSTDNKYFSLTDGVVSFTSSNPQETYLSFVLQSDNTYRIQNTVNNTTYYLYVDGETPAFTTDMDACSFFEVVYSNGCSYLRVSGTSNYLGFNGNFVFSSSYPETAILYKQDLSNDELTSVNTFQEELLEVIGTCDEEGLSLNIDEDTWNATLAVDFSVLPVAVQGYFGRATYTHNAETHNSLADIIDRYDYILAKYSQFEDFMLRKTTGLYVNNYSGSANGTYNTIFNQTNNVTIGVVVITLIISATAIVGFISYRKKRAQ